MKYFALICLLFVSTVVHGATLSWTIPDKRENGDPLPITEIQKYTISAKCNDRAIEYFIIPNANTTSWKTPAHVVGQCDFRINTTDTGNLDSKWSDVASALIKLDKPKRGGFR